VDNETLIEIHNLWYTYPNGIVALRGINTRIKEREFIAVVGANGSGKTTLIKHLNGLLKPTKGVVRVKGYDTRDKSVAELARYVGIVFQNPLNQFFEETVEKEVLFALKNIKREINKEFVEKTLRSLGIYHLLKKSPYEASLGEQKRIALASIIIYQPDVIALDEPTVGLDYASKLNLLKILIDLYQKSKTIIIVSHDVEFLARTPLSRIIILNDGKLIYDGNPRDAFYNIRILEEARLVPPQIPHLMIRLKLNDDMKPLNEEEAYAYLKNLKKV